ncbi:MAG: AAA family ATPase [Crenarchaeota archaeon]|nr:AAA family ATPase [Thermoproteota archaeon]
MYLIKLGMDYCDQAQRAYIRGDLELALRLYEKAVECFRKAVTYTSDAATRSVLSEKIREIEDTIEKLRAILQGENRDLRPRAARSPRATLPEVSESGVIQKEKVSRGGARPGTREVESDGEFVGLVETFISRANVTWDDIADLSDVKRELMSIIFFSLAIPEKPVKVDVPRRILFFGPPGTGKTMIAMALSNMLSATFFNVPISGVLSKYVGDSPKIISTLFKLARERAPSVVFMDEIEAIAVKRDSDFHQVPGLLQTLLTELDGFGSKNLDKLVLVIAATNKPWVLDEAILSRFDRKVYIPPPDKSARIELFKLHLERRGYELEGITYEELADLTEGYTGRDIANLCRKAILNMLQRANPNIEVVMRSVRNVEELRKAKYRVDRITREDFEKALEEVKPTVSKDDLRRYEEFLKKSILS